jgi:hypothetical protein
MYPGHARKARGPVSKRRRLAFSVDESSAV